jgi:hypothetical protein
VTTLTDSKKYSRAQIAELFGMRWDIETNFRHLKTTMNMDALKCKTVDGVKKELAIFVLVYNLVRQAMLDRANKNNIPLARVSFLDTIRWLLQIQHERRPMTNTLRRGRKMPRVVKRRPKAFPRMTTKKKDYIRNLYRRTITYGLS